MFIGLGSSSLLYQKVIIEYSKIIMTNFLTKTKNKKKNNYEKLRDINSKNNIFIDDKDISLIKNENSNDKKESIDENLKIKETEINCEPKIDKIENNKENMICFLLICIVSIGSYSYKIYMSLMASVYKSSEDNKAYNQTNFTEISNSSDNKFSININETIYNSDKKIFDKYYLFCYYYPYILSILLYFFLWLFFDFLPKKCLKNNEEKKIELEGNNDKIKEENKNNNDNNERPKDNMIHSYCICHICGYVYYRENIRNDIQWYKRFFNCVLDFFILSIQSIGECLNLTLCKSINHIFCNKKNKCNCLCDCCKNNGKYKRNYNKLNERYCYCYKEERKHKWFYNYITSEAHIKIIPYMLGYYLMQITTLSFEKEYQSKPFDLKIENYSDNIYAVDNLIKIYKYRDTLIYISTFFVFLLLIILLIIKSKKNVKLLDGIYTGIIINSIVSLIFSFEYILNKKNKIKDFILIPVLLNKFYFFILNYYTSWISEELKGDNLISISILISIHIMIWNGIIIMIKAYVPNNLLIIIQIFLSITTIIVFIYNNCILKIIKIIKPIKGSDISSH